MSTGLTQKQRKELELAAAMGKAVVVSIGVGTQLANSGFLSLKTCVADALDVAQTFKDTAQLHADPQRVRILTSAMPGGASRGAIIAALKSAVAEVEADERLIFFFSGHGWRIGEELYLVPQDAYDSNDASALVAFSDVEKILNGSEAKQKIVILDACLSGPDTSHFKGPLADASPKFLAEYLEHTKGIARLSAATSDTTAHTKSPSNHSLFTHYLLEALQGSPEALNDKLLTLSGTFEFVSVKIKKYAKSASLAQKPSMSSNVDGVLVLGDFRGALLQAEDLNLTPTADGLTFSDGVTFRIRDFLPDMKLKYSGDYLQGVINQKVLPRDKEDELGRFKSSLRNRYGYSSSDVSIEGRALSFPDGSYELEFEAEDDKRGILHRRVHLTGGWLDKLGELEDLLSLLGMNSPDEMEIVLKSRVSVVKTGNMLRSAGWDVKLETNSRVEASRGGFALVVESGALRVSGFSPSELFGPKADKESAGLIQAVLVGLVPAPKAAVPRLPSSVARAPSFHRVPVPPLPARARVVDAEDPSDE